MGTEGKGDVMAADVRFRFALYFWHPSKEFMKSVLIASDRSDLIQRIEKLNKDNKAVWGKMNLSQMLRHCILCEELYLGNLQVKRSFLGRIVGQLAIKSILKNDAPLKKNAPTNPAFQISEVSGDIEEDKAKWIDLVKQYENYSKPVFVHWFFGKMTKEQVGQFAFKHADHHLRQFNA